METERPGKETGKYEKDLDRYQWNLTQLENRINIFIDKINFSERNLTILRNYEVRLQDLSEQYEEMSSEYVAFLKDNTSITRDLELTGHYLNKENITRHFQLVYRDLKDRIKRVSDMEENTRYNSRPSGEKAVTKSVRSKSDRSGKTRTSGSSTMTSASSALMKTKARAKAAKAGLQYVEKEAEIKKLQAVKIAQMEYEQAEREAQLARRQKELTADLQLKMDVIACEKVVAEAEAELSVVQEMCKAEDNLLSNQSESNISEIDNHEKVRKYINEQVTDQGHKESSLNVNALSYVPVTNNNNAVNNRISNETSEITKFLLKKDLSISRLINFSDKPEDYVIWKASFKNIIGELQVTPNEEVDILTKYLGPESRKYAASMRFANIQEPDGGLNKIWTRLDERYGSPELIERCLKDRLSKFPKLTGKDHHKLYELSDLLSEILCVKNNPKYKLVLSYFDSSNGINPVVNKLPYYLQSKWTEHASKFKKKHSVVYPTFDVFVEYIQEISVRFNDPSFQYENTYTKQSSVQSPQIKTFTDKHPVKKHEHLTANKTKLSQTSADQEKCPCPIHGAESEHSLKDCRVFSRKTRDEQKDIVMKNGMCFKCLLGKHLAKDCKTNFEDTDNNKAKHNYGGERTSVKEDTTQKDSFTINNKCTQICGKFKGKSCAKTVLVNVTKGDNLDKVFQTYAIIDDQSNGSLAHSELLDYFNDNSPEQKYVLSTCLGDQTMSGRKGIGYRIQSLDEEYKFNLPGITECNQIPNVRQEIPTPEVARQYDHLKDISDKIPPYNKNAKILLLIGRDLLPAHHVLEQRIGQDHEPYAQRLKLGWVIVGESCLGMVHKMDKINVNKTNILNNGRPTYLDVCPNNFHLKTNSDSERLVDIGPDIFERNLNDDLPGLSREEKEFLEIMDKNFIKTESGNWSAPLPFSMDRPRLPNNYEQAKKRFDNLDISLKKNPIKKKDFFDFMAKILENGHAEEAPELKPNDECWYLPVFGIYHSKKKKLRVVFDSAAKHQGLSLNDVLLKGPDLTNNLAAVLLKFRKERIGVIGDLEQFFFNFRVHEPDRNYLRFLWYKGNDITKPMIEYRMRVHVFGNKPSPAVANYGLHKTICNHESEELCDELCEFVKKHFYVDDGLISLVDEENAIKLVKDTQTRLRDKGNIRLHKLSSNSLNFLRSFPEEDIVDNILRDMELDQNISQRSLGLCWKLTPDIFTFKVSDDEKPFTKRGVLSVVNGIFDPLGFVAPVVLGGKLLLRQLVDNRNLDWDDPLPQQMLDKWLQWKNSLKDLEKTKVPRPYSEISVRNSVRRELHVFADASKEAVGAVAYLKLYDVNNHNETSFIFGKSKVAPDHGHTIPRLELCGAVLATELAAFVTDNLGINLDSTHFYTDSRVVLGYIFNRTRKFYVYVTNRVDKILFRTFKEQWSYVPTEQNPADMATRQMNASELSNSQWLSGPISFLNQKETENFQGFDLVEENEDKEIRPEVIPVLKTNTLETFNSHRFEKFSKWTNLISAIARLKHFVVKVTKRERTKLKLLKDSENFVIGLVQSELYLKEKDCLLNNKPVNKDSALFNLSPYLDDSGLIRVGGRLKRLQVDLYERNPIIIPSKHHIGILLVRHFHEKAEHQGRQLTEGLIRSSGYWIVGGKRLVSSVIHKCVRCKRLRGKPQTQIMSDLPIDRITPCPPFTYIGIDVFGPWNVVARRTRGGLAHSKRWAVIFCCMVTRGIHLEVIEEMSASSFINSLVRFTSIRGPVKQIRSDRGSNFVGAVNELNVTAINVEDPKIKDHLIKENIVWIFNTPHSSHMGGSWERLIGITRRILDNMLINMDMKNFTHEVLVTFLAEVSAIVNERPLVPVCEDPDILSVLTSNMLITQKYNSNIESLDYYMDFTVKNMYKSQWRFVQILAENFWKRWRNDYLQNLQVRQKWQTIQDSIKVGDVVLVKDNEAHRNDWPLGIVEKTFPSEDKHIRKAQIRLAKTRKLCVRPITQIVLLLSSE